MIESSRAIFLSYASEDAAAAKRICDALMVGGIEVWFDQSELRGGDAWDRQIRRQIHDCGLFIAVISSHTDTRVEGYFRREWRLAVDRTLDMSDDAPFLLPVVIDSTPDATARVPDRFREVQWSRLPGGEVSAAFVERVSRLLSPTASFATVRERPPAARPALLAAPRLSVLRSVARPLPIVVAAAVILPLGYVAYDRFATSHKPVATPASAVAADTGAAASSATAPHSIAVLPFVDMSEKKDQEYFSDGLSEELLDLLAKTQGLEVIARTSSFYFKGKQATIADIAKTLNVAHVLEGSVRKAGSTIRVTAQLIRARDGVHLWSETYDRDLKDVFKVQDEIATAVVKALQMRLLPTMVTRSVAHNTDAYSLYLRGQYFARRADVADVERGIESLRKAIALEPDFAPARVDLAAALVFMGTFGNYTQEALVDARAEVDRALQLDPALQSARDVRANLAIIGWDWPAAQATIDEQLARDPRDADALLRRGMLERALGHADQAVAFLRKALQVDPLRIVTHLHLTMALNFLGRTAEGRAVADALIAISPTASKGHLLVGLDELRLGRYDAARAQFAQESGEWYRLEGEAMLAYAEKHLPDSDAALKLLIAKHHDTAAMQIAEVYAYRQERDKAFEWLDAAFRQHDPGLTVILTDPLLVSLRSDRRFDAIRRRMFLPG